MSSIESAVAEAPKQRRPRRPTGTVTIRLPDDLREALEEIAESEASFVSAVIRRAAQFDVTRLQRARATRERRDRDHDVAR